MIPHAKPLPDEDVEFYPSCHVVIYQFRRRIIACLIPRVEKSGSNHAKISWGNPQLISFQKEPLNTANDVRVDYQQKRVERNLGERFCLHSKVRNRDHLIKLANPENFQELAHGGKRLKSLIS